MSRDSRCECVDGGEMSFFIFGVIFEFFRVSSGEVQ